MSETMIHRWGGSKYQVYYAMCNPKIVGAVDTIAFDDRYITCPACHEAMKADNVADALADTAQGFTPYRVPDDANG